MTFLMATALRKVAALVLLVLSEQKKFLKNERTELMHRNYLGCVTLTVNVPELEGLSTSAHF